MILTDDDIEVFSWSALERSRGGQHVGTEPGVVVVHRATGITVVERGERSQIRCRAAAKQKLQDVLEILETVGVLDALKVE